MSGSAQIEAVQSANAAGAGKLLCWKRTIEVKNQQGKAMSLSDPNSPQVLASLLTEQEAAMMVNYLDELGINAKIFPDDAATVIPALPHVRVVVRQADLSQAKEALNRIHTRNQDS